LYIDKIIETATSEWSAIHSEAEDRLFHEYQQLKLFKNQKIQKNHSFSVFLIKIQEIRP
jgi:hypothetical protein